MRTATTVMRLPIAMLLTLMVANVAAAQTTSSPRERKHDAGGSITWLNLNGFSRTPTGVGGRVGYHVVDLLTLDMEANLFPSDNPATGRMLQAFAGAKLGGRSRVFGLFGKVRPGGMRFSRDVIAPNTVCPLIFPTPQSCFASRRAFALDYGSVIEIYPNDRSIIRVDTGTSYIWYHRNNGTRERTGNFQITVGLARRF